MANLTHCGKLAPGVRVDAVLTPRISTWGATPAVEPEIRDLAII